MSLAACCCGHKQRPQAGGGLSTFDSVAAVGHLLTNPLLFSYVGAGSRRGR